MVGTTRSLVIAAALLAATAAARGQPAGQVPAAEALPDASPSAPALVVDGAASSPPWPAAGYKVPSPEESLAPAAGSGILVDGPGQPPPGWFLSLEKAAIGAHFTNHLTASVPVTGTRTDVLHVPSAPLDWGFSPRLQIGYRDPNYPSEYLFSFRELATQGSANVGDTHLRSRLDLNVIDADYARRVRLADGFDVRWLVGARITFLYYDTQAQLPTATADLLGTANEQHATNFFVGAGPHVGLDLYRRLPLAGWALYARGDGSGVTGSPRQTYSESFGPGVAGTLGVPNASVADQASQFVWTLGGQVGLSWAPPRWPGKQLTFGYQVNQWWRVGMDSNLGSRGDLTEQGVFLRGEIVF